MNSPAAPPSQRRWILTTCRDRLEHLRESLPSVLQHLPNWTPLVVCCDDPEAADYAMRTCFAAHRGCVLTCEQGQYFNKLEAERFGLQCLTKVVTDLEADELVCFWDADVVATVETHEVLDGLSSDDVAVCGWGAQPDDFGFLVSPLGVLYKAISKIGENQFVGYGPEDMAIRIAIWSIVRKPFVQVPAMWAHKQHTDHARSQHHPTGIKACSSTNGRQLDRIRADLVAASDVAQLNQDALVSPQPLCLRSQSHKGTP
jgi:hypothetical protein